MRILFLTSWGSACGIYTYSQNLIEELEKLPNISVQIYSDTTNFTGISKLAKEQGIDVVHIQHEFGISLSPEPLMSVISKFRMSGIPVVMTMHTEDKGVCILFDGVPDAIILHNDAVGFSKKSTFSKFYQIPHGIPELAFSPTDKADFRKKYGIPEDAFVVGTCGFVSKDRAVIIEDFVTGMIPTMQVHKDIFIHLPVSAHRSDINGSFAGHVRANLEALMEKHGLRDRFLMTAEFMPNDAFRERLHTLDLGFSYMPNKVVSNSGSAADIISAGVPMVVNSAAHFSHLMPYCDVFDEGSDNIHSFINFVAYRMTQPGGRNSDVMIELRKKSAQAVADLGYSVQAKRHIDIYEYVMNGMRMPMVMPQLNYGINEKPVAKAVPMAQIMTKLNRKSPIAVTMPNSLWQVMLLWRKLSKLADAGFSVSLNIQNEGPLDINTFKFCVPGISEVVFNDVGLISDDRIIRVHSRSLAQNVTTDVEDWLKKDSFKNLFSFFDDTSTGASYTMKLGSYSEKTALRIASTSSGFKTILVIADDTPDYLVEVMRAINKKTQGNYQVVVAGTPMTNAVVAAFYSRVKELLPATKVSMVIEDFRTIMAICDLSELLITPWNEFAVYGLMTDVDGHIFCTEEWQQRLLTDFAMEEMTDADYGLTRKMNAMIVGAH